jgi:hypothetical protein
MSGSDSTINLANAAFFSELAYAPIAESSAITWGLPIA